MFRLALSLALSIVLIRNAAAETPTPSAAVPESDPFLGASAEASLGGAAAVAATALPTSSPEVPLEAAAPDPATANSETSLKPGWQFFPDIPAQKDQLVRSSALRDLVLTLPPQVTEVYAARELKLAWEGNVPSLQTSIDRIIARFRRDPESKLPFDARHDPEWFDLTIDFRNRMILLFHSHALRKKERGAEILVSNAEQERRFIEGQGASGMAVLIPRTALTGQNARAMLLCPRSIFRMRRRAKPDEIFFVESPYKLSRVLVSAKASVQGQALSGGDLGLARASIVTSPNIPRPLAWTDESYAVDPRVSLSYVPIANEQRDDIDPDGAVVAGIEARLELQRAAGFKRTSIQQSVLWFKEFLLGSEEPWFIRLRRDQPPSRVAPGRCYSLLSERLVEQRFTKEPFVLPEQLGGDLSATPHP